MSAPFVVYGAGHSGLMVAERACALGRVPVLAGRNVIKLRPLAGRLGATARVAGLDEPDRLRNAFAGAVVVLNAAGPFSRTADAVLDACLAVGAHYLDLTGEVRVIDRLSRRHDDARQHGIMLMPAVGYEVVASDCLAAHVAARLPTATTLRIATTPAAWASRGSTRTLGEALGAGMVRASGALRECALGTPRRTFDFGAGPQPALGLPLADLVTAYYTTAIPNIETYVAGTSLVRALVASTRAFGWLWRTAPGRAWLEATADLLPAEPPEPDVPAPGMVVVAETEDPHGRIARARLRTPEAYGFTAMAAVAAIERVLHGDVEPGFQTPARIWGADFALALPDVTREDVVAA